MRSFKPEKEHKKEPSAKRAVKNAAVRLAFAFALFMACLALIWAVKARPSAAEAYYVPFSVALAAALGRLTAFTEYSVSELVVFLILFICLMGLAASAFLLVRGMIKGIIVRTTLSQEDLKTALVRVFCAAAWIIAGCSVLFFWFTAAWGLNYYTPGLKDRLGIEPGRYSAQDLYDTVILITGRLNALAPEVPRGSDGVGDFGGFERLSGMASDGFAALARDYPTFRAAYPKPKRVVNWEFMSRLGISGIYSPFLGECNVNTDSDDASLPFIISHEMSHRLAVAPEAEANFTAFLACLYSPYSEYRYSGYFMAFIYCYNALSASGAAQGDLYAVFSGLDRRVTADISSHDYRLKKYEGKTRDFGERINDTYLKSLGQAEGVKSYGLVVDLIIAYLENDRLSAGKH